MKNNPIVFENLDFSKTEESFRENNTSFFKRLSDLKKGSILYYYYDDNDLEDNYYELLGIENEEEVIPIPVFFSILLGNDESPDNIEVALSQIKSYFNLWYIDRDELERAKEDVSSLTDIRFERSSPEFMRFLKEKDMNGNGFHSYHFNCLSFVGITHKNEKVIIKDNRIMIINGDDMTVSYVLDSDCEAWRYFRFDLNSKTEIKDFWDSNPETFPGKKFYYRKIKFPFLPVALLNRKNIKPVRGALNISITNLSGSYCRPEIFVVGEV